MEERVPFKSDSTCREAIQEAAAELIAHEQKRLINTLMAPQNQLHYSHGSKWKQPALPSAIDGAMRTHSAGYELPFQRLVDGDLRVVPESIQTVAGEMRRQFLESMYSLLNATCEQSGNTVSARQAGGLAEAFEQAIQKIEFGVDRNGNVSMPQIHIGNDEQLRTALEAQPPEFRERIDALVQVKIEAALTQEAERKSKFKSTP